MDRVLVTGATGFLGGALLARLSQSGTPAVGIGRDPDRIAALRNLGFQMVAHDISQPLSDIPDIDAVVHCAALSAPFGRRQAFVAANVTGTQNIADFAAARGIERVVHISSPTVGFAFADQLDQREDAPLPPPVNHYAATKAAGETLIRRHLPKAVILRPRGIYGAGDTALLPRVLRAAKARPLPLFRDGAARIDLTHVDDVVSAILAALDAPDAQGTTLNVSGGEVIAVRDIVDQACARAGITPRWRAARLWPMMQAARLIEGVAHLRSTPREPLVTRYGLGLFAYAQSLDISAARRVMGWQPQVTFAQGLDRTFGEGA
ncbi:NAD-dependent epimerase/dehydratase family protein [Octadecabacter sp. R77987]|uniref:NAD-dependent epimerase/dehydratase family protein n=1 Tax=Octadecabacter sp. R77987 TaxID=3093874 RepID=UPI00366BC162